MEKIIFEVHTLNQKIKSLLESDFSLVGICVKGEVTSLNKHYTGHYYFKLRDDDGSLLSCTMFSSYTKYAPSSLKNGDQVILTGSINVYVNGGTYSFNARKIEMDGLGSYLLELKKLEEKLTKEGLFSKAKRKIPLLPKRIAVLTASTGAAIHDVTSSIQKRCKTEILIFPCQVQGKEAPISMVETLKKAYTYDIDLLILTRGGGSKDDLYAFNDEELVRTLSSSPCPTITAVGHSIDTTLVDKVSDLACITPTEAGNNAIAKVDDLRNSIDILLDKANNALLNNLTYFEQRFNTNIERLNALSPINKLNLYGKELDNIVSKLDLLLKNKIDAYKFMIKNNLDKLSNLNEVLDNAILSKINEKSLKINGFIKELDALSPTNLLLKGYSFVYNEDNSMIKSINDINVDETLTIEVNDGIIKTLVKEKRNK